MRPATRRQRGAVLRALPVSRWSRICRSGLVARLQVRMRSSGSCWMLAKPGRDCHSRGMTGRLLCRLRIHRWRVQRNAENVVFRECSRCGKLWEEVMAMKYRPM